MAERVDLDAVQARDERANKPPYSVRDIAESQADVPALVAELWELRERYGKDDEVWCGARHDQAGSAYCVEMAGHERDGVGHMWSQHADPSTHDRSGMG